ESGVRSAGECVWIVAGGLSQCGMDGREQLAGRRRGAVRFVRRRQQARGPGAREGDARAGGGGLCGFPRCGTAGGPQRLLPVQRRAATGESGPRRDLASRRELKDQSKPLRRRTEHSDRYFAGGRSGASRQGRLLAGGISHERQLCRSGTGDWHVDSRFSGGDAMMNRTMLIGPVAVFAIATLVACSENKPAAQARAERVHGVAVMQVQKATVPDVVEATGTVRAALSAQLASQVMGTITRVNVHEGDRVRRGEVLVSIDEAQQQATYASAKAGLQASQQSIAAADADYALAESTMQRYQMLYDKTSVSPQEYDEVKTRLVAAKARRDAAQAGRTQAEAGVSQAGTAMSFTKVRAPFDGMVIARLAEPGAMAVPGVPLLTIDNPSHFRLEAQVDESKIGAVRLRESVPVVIDSLGDQPITGKVVQIVP